MKVIAKAPTRISLFGGGTDVGEFASIYGGICINFAINIYQTIGLDDDTTMNEFVELPENANVGFYNAILQATGCPPVKLAAHFDGPIESGLGSSASATVALVAAVRAIKGAFAFDRAEIAKTAWEIEVGQLGLFGGKQDQYAAAYGGVNAMMFQNGKVEIVSLKPEFLTPILPYMNLFYLGQNRKSSDIQEGLRKLTKDQIEALHKIKKLANDSILYFQTADAEAIGKLLDKGWRLKKKSNKKVSNTRIDKVYKAGKDAGAWGGKVLGSGGGGHILFMCPLEKKEEVIKAMSELEVKEVPFEVDWEGLTVNKL